MARTKEQVLRDLGYDPKIWTVTERTDTGEEFIADPSDPNGLRRIPNPARDQTWFLTDGRGGRQKITVKPVPVKPYEPGTEWSPTEPTYEITDAPDRLAPAGTSQPAKGLERVTASGVLEHVIDDQGTWSAVIKDGKVVKAPSDPPTDTSPTTKEINGKTFQWNASADNGAGGKGAWVVASGLPATTPKPSETEPTVNTDAKQIPEWDGEKWIWKDNPAYKEKTATPQTPEQAALTSAQAALTGAQATTAGAEAAVAGPAAETALRKAQADADTAALDLEDARRKSRQAPTDTQAQAAISAAQRAAELANQSLEQQIGQAGQINPIAVEAAKVSLTRARTAERQDILGPLVGLRERIAEIKSLVASGEISPEQGDMMVSATTRGTTVAEGLKDIGAERTARRTQDVSSRNQLASTFGSTLTSGFSTLADMNKYAAVGSSAGADAFMGLLDIAQERLKQYELPPSQETDFLGLGAPRGGPGVSGMVNTAQQQLGAQPPPAAMTPPVAPPIAPPVAGVAPSAPSTPITINIGGGTQPQPGISPTAGMTQALGDPYGRTNANVGLPFVTPTASQYGRSPTAGATQALGDPYGRTNALVSSASRSVPSTFGDIFDAYGLPRPGTR